MESKHRFGSVRGFYNTDKKNGFKKQDAQGVGYASGITYINNLLPVVKSEKDLKSALNSALASVVYVPDIMTNEDSKKWVCGCLKGISDGFLKYK